MSKGAASEEVLGQLHARVAEVLLAMLEKREYEDPETGETVPLDPDPRIISSAVTFLNNNKVKMSPFLDNTVSEIQKKLDAKKGKRFSVIRNQARDDALKAAGMGD